jgi:hypothetical protein
VTLALENSIASGVAERPGHWAKRSKRLRVVLVLEKVKAETGANGYRTAGEISDRMADRLVYLPSPDPSAS